MTNGLFGYSPYVDTTVMLPASSLPLAYSPAEALPVHQAAGHVQLAVLPGIHCTTWSCPLLSGI